MQEIINLLAEYNALAGTGNTIASANEALRNADFLKYATREIKTTIDNMRSMSTLHNAEDIPRFTDRGKLVAGVLAQFNISET